MSVLKTHNKSKFLKKNCRGLNNFSPHKNKRLLELAISKSLRNAYMNYPLIIAIHLGYEDDILENFRFISTKFVTQEEITKNEVDSLILEAMFHDVNIAFNNLKPLKK
jgi:hypothetical protein